MPRGGGGSGSRGGGERGGRGGGRSGGRGGSDTGSGTSASFGGGSEGGGGEVGAASNSTTGGVTSAPSRETRRGNAPKSTAPTADEAAAAETELGLEAGVIGGLDAEKAAAVAGLAEARRGTALTSIAGFFGSIAQGRAEEAAREALSTVGVDLDTSLSTKEAASLGIGVAKESFSISQALGLGVSPTDVAVGTLSNPASAIAGLVGRQVGKFGQRFSASLSAEQKAAGPSAADREAGIGGRGDSSEGDSSTIGSTEPLTAPQSSTSESLTDTGVIKTRPRQSLDIRRRTRPAAFIGGGPFTIGSKQLTG